MEPNELDDKVREDLFKYYLKEFQNMGFLDIFMKLISEIEKNKDTLALICLVDIMTAVIKKSADRMCVEGNEFKAWMVDKPGRC